MVALAAPAPAAAVVAVVLRQTADQQTQDLGPSPRQTEKLFVFVYHCC